MSKANVPIGTIGHVIAISLFGAFLCASPRPALASSGGWTQKISDSFSKLLGQAKRKNLRPIVAKFIVIAQSEKWDIKVAGIERTMKKISQEDVAFHASGFVYPGSLAGVMGKVDAVYQRGQDLRQTQNYRQMPPEALQPLEGRWLPIEKTHDDLSIRASDIDSRDSDLGNESASMDANRAELKSSEAGLNGDIEAYNENCAGKTLPTPEYDQCVSQRNDILSRQAQLDEAIGQFNERAASDKQTLLALKAALTDWVNEFKAWAADFDQWMSDAKNAVSNQERTCTDEQYADLKAKKDAACPSDLPACQEDENCDILREKLKNNEACLVAREDLDNTCFNGGDDGHKDARRRLRITIVGCKEYIAKNECVEN